MASEPFVFDPNEGAVALDPDVTAQFEYDSDSNLVVVAGVVQATIWISTLHPALPTLTELQTGWQDRLEAGVFARWDEFTDRIGDSPLARTLKLTIKDSPPAIVNLTALISRVTNPELRDMAKMIEHWQDLRAVLLDGIADGSIAVSNDLLNAWDDLVVETGFSHEMLFGG